MICHTLKVSEELRLNIFPPLTHVHNKQKNNQALIIRGNRLANLMAIVISP